MSSGKRKLLRGQKLAGLTFEELSEGDICSDRAVFHKSFGPVGRAIGRLGFSSALFYRATIEINATVSVASVHDIAAMRKSSISIFGYRSHINRRTIVVHTRLAGHMARVAAARAGACGVQIMTMDHVAARLAGGFIRPIDADALHDALKSALGETPLGELEGIKSLPGMVRAAADTLGKVWRAGIDLNAGPEQPRLRALAALELAALAKLPPAMKPTPVLVEAALARLKHAPAIIGPVEVHGHSEMPPCWRRLLLALAETVPVTWVAGPRLVPEWLAERKIEVKRGEAEQPEPPLLSCANPMHEAIEALRWARALIAAGTARPEEIAIAAASPAELDDHMLALRRETNLPLHFVHGIESHYRARRPGRSGSRGTAGQRLVAGTGATAVPAVARSLAGVGRLAARLGEGAADRRAADDAGSLDASPRERRRRVGRTVWTGRR